MTVVFLTWQGPWGVFACLLVFPCPDFSTEGSSGLAGCAGPAGWQIPQSRVKILGVQVGDKFGESLGGSQAPPSFWEVPGLPRKFPEFPRKFSATSPEVLSLWTLTAIQRFPRSSPNFPGSSPNFRGSSGTSPEVSPFLWEAWHPLLTHKNFLWANRAELKVTHLRWRSPICGFLRFSAKVFGFLRTSAVFCALQMLEFPGEWVNLRKSAVFCENLRFGLSLSPYSSVTLSAPWFFFRHANAQPFLCNELGPFQAILGNFQEILGYLLRPFSGDFRQVPSIFGQFQAILGGFGSFRRIFGGQNPPWAPETH